MRTILCLILFSFISLAGYSQDEVIDKKVEKTAFGDANFGMTWDEALQCDIFNQKGKGKKFSKYKRKDRPILVADNYELGNKKYRVRCVFEDQKLSEVTTGSYLRYASELDGEIRNEFMNLKEIFSKKYGPPFEDPGYPSILNYEYTNTFWVYGEKVIMLSIKESDSMYYTFATISLINDETINKTKEKADELLEKIDESSELF